MTSTLSVTLTRFGRVIKYLINQEKTGRGEKIRTSGPCLPKAVLYQAELHPEPRAIIHLHTIVGKKCGALWGNRGGNSLQDWLCTFMWRIANHGRNPSPFSNSPHTRILEEDRQPRAGRRSSHGPSQGMTMLRQQRLDDDSWQRRAVKEQVDAVCRIHGSNRHIGPVPQSRKRCAFLFARHN